MSDLEVLQAVIWPGAFVVALLVFCLVFWKPIAALIGKLKRVKTPYGELSTDDIKGQKTEAEPIATTSELTRIFDNQVVAQIERNIRSDPTFQSETNATRREDVLIRLLASARLAQAFERVHGQIYGTQLNCLNSLASAHTPMDESAIKSFYDSGASRFPDGYKDKSFDDWARFLESSGLMQRVPNGFEITPMGREYLKFIIDQRLPQHKPG